MEVADERVGRESAVASSPPTAAVVTLTAADFADSPAAFTAETWKLYADDAASPVTVAEVPVVSRTLVPPRWTR